MYIVLLLIGHEMGNQWDNFLKNCGVWRGSFANVTLDGEILSTVPSILSLTEVDDPHGDVVSLHLRRFENGGYDSEATSNIQYDFRSLGRHLIFSEMGSFSKGAMCLSSISDFIAEFGFVHGDRRLRMVQMYNSDFRFNQLVFIREFREGTDAQERPALTVEQLVGEWKMEALTYTPDFQPPTKIQGSISLEIQGNHLASSITYGDHRIDSKAPIDGNKILYTEGPLPRQVTLLPDGGSINVPLELKRKQPFFVEVGWLIEPNLRQRILRNFNVNGDWINSVFITETRKS